MRSGMVLRVEPAQEAVFFLLCLDLAYDCSLGTEPGDIFYSPDARILVSCVSNILEVFLPKQFEGMRASTPFICYFARQGLQIKIRQHLRDARSKRKKKPHVKLEGQVQSLLHKASSRTDQSPLTARSEKADLRSQSQPQILPTSSLPTWGIGRANSRKQE